MQGALRRALDVLRRQLVAVVHLDARAKEEAVRASSVRDLPAIGDVGYDVPALVEVDEAREDQMDRLTGEPFRGAGWIEAADVLERGEMERAAATRSRVVAVLGGNGRREGAAASAGDPREAQGAEDPRDPGRRGPPRRRADRAHRAAPLRAC